MSNIEDIFHDQLGDFEAPFSADEMQSDWSAVQNNLGQFGNTASSASNASTTSSISNVTQWLSSVKMWIIGAVGVGAIVTGVIVLSNTKDEPKKASNEIVNQTISQEEPAITLTPKVVLDESISKAENQTAQSTPKTDNKKGNPSNTSPNSLSNSNSLLANNQYSNFINNSHQPVLQNNTSNKGMIGNQATNFFDASKNKPNLTDTSICMGTVYEIKQVEGLFSVSWGDGIKDDKNRHQYKQAGDYQIEADNFKRKLSVIASPEAHFNKIGSNGLQVTFRNLSTLDNRMFWSFGDGSDISKSDETIVKHNFPSDGDYKVKLIIKARTGCYDSSEQVINVNSQHKIEEISNIFTPNGDGLNDAFSIGISGEELFDLTIINFKGETVYQADNKQSAWDGSLFNKGNPCPQGTYLYVLRYRFSGEKECVINGEVFLKR